MVEHFELQFLHLTPKLSSSLQLRLHAFKLWLSVGFLMHVGILLNRFSHNMKSAKAVITPNFFLCEKMILVTLHLV